MPSFILRGIDAALMERVKARAEAEGVTVKAAILRCLADYVAVDEEMVTHQFRPLLGHADEVYCTDCEYHRDHRVHRAPKSTVGAL